MLRGKHQGESAVWLSGKPRCGLFRDVGRMVVEDQFNGCFGRIGGIEFLEEFDEFA